MTFKKRRLFSIIILTISISSLSFAQSGVNSPYTRYGFGQLGEQNMSANNAMGGVGYALRSKSFINLINPAAISAVDSLTFMMDAGISVQNANFSENGVKMNAKNSSLDYIALQFRLVKDLGMSIGILPYSNVGYSFSTSQNYTSSDNNESFTSYNTFKGDGGLHQVFMGFGYNLTKEVAIGGLFSYLYGDITHSIGNSYSDANIRSRARYYSTSITNYKADFGLQYTKQLNGNNNFTIGLTYSLGHNLDASSQTINQVLSSSTVQSGDTTTTKDAFKLPHTFGVGIAYRMNDKWTFAMDYTLQKWGNATFFNNQQGSDRNKISLGVEYFANDITTRSIFKRTRYRAGIYYSDPYTKIDGKKGSYEYGISAGVSIPIINTYNNRSYLNISGQYIHVEPRVEGLIKESYLRLNIGFSFNENWFMKWKVD